MENDNNFNTLYDIEFNKIPFIFRFGRKSAKAIIIALSVFFVVLCVLVILLIDAYSDGVAKPNAGFISVAALIDGICTAISAAWIVLAEFCERRAFKKASNLALKVREAELQRNTKDSLFVNREI